MEVLYIALFWETYIYKHGEQFKPNKAIQYK